MEEGEHVFFFAPLGIPLEWGYKTENLKFDCKRTTITNETSKKKRNTSDLNMNHGNISAFLLFFICIFPRSLNFLWRLKHFILLTWNNNRRSYVHNQSNSMEIVNCNWTLQNERLWLWGLFFLYLLPSSNSPKRISLNQSIYVLRIEIDHPHASSYQSLQLIIKINGEIIV